MDHKEAQRLWIEQYEHWCEAFNNLRDAQAEISKIMRAGESRIKNAVLRDLQQKADEYAEKADGHQSEMDRIVKLID